MSEITRTPTTSDSSPPSALAMDRFIERSPGLREPRLAVKVPGLPTLPDLKSLAQARRAEGKQVIDQSAGDIDDVGQPLAPDFVAWLEEARDELVQQGQGAFRRTANDAHGYPGNYQRQYPVVVDRLAQSWGLAGDWRGMHTVSGRNALDFAMRGLLARAAAAGHSDPPALIVDPLAWSGYGPLAADLGIALVHAPCVEGRGLRASAEGVREAIAFCKASGLAPVGVIPILPSNPTGVGLEPTDLLALVEAAAAADVPVLVDAFYSPLAPEGHAKAVPMGWLQQQLAPEALGYLGVLVGETKVTSSQNKTGTLLWCTPPGHRTIADAVVGTAFRRLSTTNSYPRPHAALVAWALHSFPAGVHAAMGPRYEALNATREAMREAADSLGLPLSIGGSFYGTVALVDDEGQSLIRDDEGRPVQDPRAVSGILIERFGLVGAPGGMFSPAPEANTMVRLTAAVTLEDVRRVRAIFAQMVHGARDGKAQ